MHDRGPETLRYDNLFGLLILKRFRLFLKELDRAPEFVRSGPPELIRAPLQLNQRESHQAPAGIGYFFAVPAFTSPLAV